MRVGRLKLILLLSVVFVGLFIMAITLQKSKPEGGSGLRFGLDAVEGGDAVAAITYPEEIRPASMDIPWTKEGRVKARGILSRFDEGAELDEVEEGMITSGQAIEIAHKMMRSKVYDQSVDVGVSLMEDHYIVKFYEFQNPLIHMHKKVGTWLVIDAWSGKPIGIRHAQGGPRIARMAPPPEDITEEEHSKFEWRISTAGAELAHRLREGKKLDSEVVEGFVVPGEAALIGINFAQKRGRGFDSQREPMSVLVRDVYIVVLWRPVERLVVGNPAYDSLVFIDARSGRVLGMEITNK